MSPLSLKRFWAKMALLRKINLLLPDPFHAPAADHKAFARPHVLTQIHIPSQIHIRPQIHIPSQIHIRPQIDIPNQVHILNQIHIQPRIRARSSRRENRRRPVQTD